MHVRGLHEGPDLVADGADLGRVHRGDVAVLVQQLLEPRDVAVRLRTRHRRHQMVDDRGVGAPFGLRPLAGVVDEERVDQRQVRDRGVGRTVRRQCGVLARQPLERAVLADVHQRVRPESVPQPPVRGQVVVRGRELGVVVDRHRVLAEPAGRLDEQHHVAGLQGGQHDLAGVVDEQLARRLAPRLDHLVPQSLRKIGGPAEVVLTGDPHVTVGELGGGEPLLVLTARLDECVDEGVPGRGVVAVGLPVQEPPDQTVRGAQVVAVLAHAAQQPDGGHGRVQSHGVADARVLGGVGRQHQGDAALGRRDVPQPGVGHGDPGHAGAAFRIGHVPGEPVGVDLLEGERHGDDPAVELGDRDLVGRVQRVDAVVGSLPLRAAPGQAQALDDGDVQRGDALHVPALVVATGARGARRGAAGREHRHDQRVERAEGVEQLVRRRAQRAREHRHAHGLTRGVDRIGQGVRERRVPAHLVGAVVEHAHARQVARRGAGPLGQPPHRDGHGRFEPGTGEQHGVGQEGVELPDV